MLKNDFVKNAMKLLTGTTIAHAITFLFSPIITRVYSPSEFGLYTLFLTIGTSLGLFATMRYEMAILLPKDEKEADSLKKLCIFSSLIISIIILFATLIYNSISNEGNKLLLGLFIFVLFTGLYQTYYYLSNRSNDYKGMGNSRIIQTLLFSVLSIAFYKIGGTGLVIAHILSVIASYIYLKNRRSNNFFEINFQLKGSRSIIKVAKKYKDMPMYNSIHAFMDVIMNNGLLFLISIFYGSAVLGLYSFAWKVLRAPLAVIGSAVGQVYLNRASQYYNDKQAIKPLMNKIIFRLLLVALPLFLILGLEGDVIFSFVFGQSWKEAGSYVQILSPWLFFNFMSSPIVQTFVVLNKQRNALVYSFIQTVMTISTIIAIPFFSKDIYTLLPWLSLIGSLSCIVFIIWIYKIVSEYEKKIISE
ncbi:oligosaccharide flippase family protein [Bacillus cereus]|uniref:lipopolysaccharide biosynthesis protein n=4 Tax=Bacillus cereus TaxID=1396 RepID=UPI001F0ACA57|nr:oligosaccharide flippase family protein [Bacillus cereus]MEB9945315.1 oligosaccharide flippase family protein [Bacillus cereus]